MLILHPKVQELLIKHLSYTEADIKRMVIDYNDMLIKTTLGTISLYLAEAENPEAEKIINNINTQISHTTNTNDLNQKFEMLFNTIPDREELIKKINENQANVSDLTDSFIYEALNTEQAKIDLLKIIEEDLERIQKFEKKYSEYYSENPNN